MIEFNVTQLDLRGAKEVSEARFIRSAKVSKINTFPYFSLLKLAYTIARLIWNAEISISVAIHCYERLH